MQGGEQSSNAAWPFHHERKVVPESLDEVYWVMYNDCKV